MKVRSLLFIAQTILAIGANFLPKRRQKGSDKEATSHNKAIWQYNACAGAPKKK